MTVRVRAMGGLANRLRVLLSYRAAYPGCEVVWVPDGEIARARFEDVFEPLRDVVLLDVPAGGELATTDPIPAGDWGLSYRDLRLLPGLHERWRETRGGRGRYAAMHVRRTDLPLDQRYSGEADADFIAWGRDRAAQELSVYLATDNGTTYRLLADGIGPAAWGQGPAREHPDQDASGQRNTTLGEAAVDLFVCAGSSDFKGCAGSSFTHTVHRLRGIPGWWR